MPLSQRLFENSLLTPEQQHEHATQAEHELRLIDTTVDTKRKNFGPLEKNVMFFNALIRALAVEHENFNRHYNDFRASLYRSLTKLDELEAAHNKQFTSLSIDERKQYFEQDAAFRDALAEARTKLDAVIRERHKDLLREKGGSLGVLTKKIKGDLQHTRDNGEIDTATYDRLRDKLRNTMTGHKRYERIKEGGKYRTVTSAWLENEKPKNMTPEERHDFLVAQQFIDENHDDLETAEERTRLEERVRAFIADDRRSTKAKLYLYHLATRYPLANILIDIWNDMDDVELYAEIDKILRERKS